MSLKKKVGIVFFVLGIAAICELLTTIILGRNLPAEVFGKFKFINTIVILLSSLLLFGQNAAIIRVIGKNDFKKYNWRKFIITCLIFSAIAGLIAVLGISLFYKLNKEIIFIYIAFISAVGIEYFSSILRSREKYSASIILSKFTSVIFFIAILAIFYILRNQNPWLILSSYSIVFISSFLSGLYAVRKIECGTVPFPSSIIKEGLWLFLITISFTVMVQIDQFFIVKMLGYEYLAGYISVITVTRGFELLATALWFVLMPHYSKDYSRSIKMDTFKVILAGGVLAVLYFIGGNFLLRAFFNGKFDQAMFLIKFFIVIGFFRVLYAIPSGIIGGRLSSKFLRAFLVTCLIGILINVAGNYFLIPIWGLKGSAISTMSSWIFRVITAYIIVNKEKSYFYNKDSVEWQTV